MDKRTFASVLAFLAAGYPRFKLQPETVTTYYAVLGDLPEELLKAATLEYATQDTPWFPAAGQLRQIAFDLIDKAAGKVGAREAWGLVVKAASSVGHGAKPEFSEPLIWKAIEDVGGWRHICMTPEDSLFSTRARFIEAYEQRRRDDRHTSAMLPHVRDVVARLGDGSRLLSPGGESGG